MKTNSEKFQKDIAVFSSILLLSFIGLFVWLSYHPATKYYYMTFSIYNNGMLQKVAHLNVESEECSTVGESLKKYAAAKGLKIADIQVNYVQEIPKVVYDRVRKENK